MNPCTCEHAAHFDPKMQTPNTNPGHKYGQGFCNLVIVRTPYGTFAICKDCAADCYQEFPTVS